MTLLEMKYCYVRYLIVICKGDTGAIMKKLGLDEDYSLMLDIIGMLNLEEFLIRIRVGALISKGGLNWVNEEQLWPKGYKLCKGCWRLMLRSLFHKDAGKKDGLEGKCKVCRKVQKAISVQKRRLKKSA